MTERLEVAQGARCQVTAAQDIVLTRVTAQPTRTSTETPLSPGQPPTSCHRPLGTAKPHCLPPTSPCPPLSQRGHSPCAQPTSPGTAAAHPARGPRLPGEQMAAARCGSAACQGVAAPLVPAAPPATEHCQVPAGSGDATPVTASGGSAAPRVGEPKLCLLPKLPAAPAAGGRQERGEVRQRTEQLGWGCSRGARAPGATPTNSLQEAGSPVEACPHQPGQRPCSLLP